MADAPDLEQITIAITPDMARMVEQAVQDGGYASASEVVRDALRLWKEQRKEPRHGSPQPSSVIDRLRGRHQRGGRGH
jgi:putative addiction module CopG family antidote